MNGVPVILIVMVSMFDQFVSGNSAVIVIPMKILIVCMDSLVLNANGLGNVHVKESRGWKSYEIALFRASHNAVESCIYNHGSKGPSKCNCLRVV